MPKRRLSRSDARAETHLKQSVTWAMTQEPWTRYKAILLEPCIDLSFDVCAADADFLKKLTSRTGTRTVRDKNYLQKFRRRCEEDSIREEEASAAVTVQRHEGRAATEGTRSPGMDTQASRQYEKGRLTS